IQSTYIKVELVEGAVGVGAVAVGIVSPHRIELPTDYSPVAYIIAVIHATARIGCIREAAAYERIGCPGGATVRGERGVVFAIVVRCAQIYLCVVAFVDRLLGIYQVDAAVERPACRVPN